MHETVEVEVEPSMTSAPSSPEVEYAWDSGLAAAERGGRAEEDDGRGGTPGIEELNGPGLGPVGVVMESAEGEGNRVTGCVGEAGAPG